MANVQPLVSIGLPVYNGERTIRQALDSLLAQDYQNFELIISDNASTDETQAICREYAAQDQRIRYCRNESNHGSVRNFNRVFELSSGQYFAWAAADDWRASTFITKCAAALEKVPSAVLCYTLVQFVDRDGQNLEIVDPEMYTYRLRPLERLHTVILRLVTDVALYGLIRADALRRTTLQQSCFHSDKSLLYQLSILGDIIKVPEVLHYYRFVEKSMEQRSNMLGMAENLMCRPITPRVSLRNAVIKAILHLPIHPLRKPLLVVDALYCLNRRYRTDLKQEQNAIRHFRYLVAKHWLVGRLGRNG